MKKVSALLSVLLFLLFISCSGKKNEGISREEMEGIIFDIKTGGVAYDVINNEVDYEKGHHFVVTMNISNGTQESIRFNSNSFKLISGSGHEIQLPTNEDGLGIANKIFLDSPINPGDTREAVLMFMIKEPQKDFKLKISSHLSNANKIINL